MKQLNFNELSDDNKSIIVANYAEYVTTQQNSMFMYHLYTLHGHFIELTYNIKDRKVVLIKLLDYKSIDFWLINVHISKEIYKH